ncbi:hypothetical protein J4Q44_G00384480 [Coregonus suidteri]|uniref:TERF1-interacting nuclear factor 2 N-terminal domain-containing protein n=1 Tax=Coregonus suidteri TaxID=861788 RepID=A0AAN8KEX1_9TELE
MDDIDYPLPFSSLRFLVPPLRLMSAFMWQVAQQRAIKHYGKLEEFVTVVTQTVPELITDRQRTLLLLALRARITLQLFQGEHPEDLNKIKIHLDRFSCCGLSKNNDAQIDALEANLLKLTKNLLEDPVERIRFFKADFPVVYGCDFDRALQALVCQFLSRLEDLLPVPDLKQTASWLSAVPSASDECLQPLSHTEDLQYLLQHHTCCGKLDKTFPSSEEDCILASLSLPTPVGVAYASDSKLDVLPNLEGSTHVSREMEALSDSRDYQQAESRARFHGNQNCKEERASTMTASWLSAVPSASDECLQPLSHTEDLQYLLQHHTCCGKLDKTFPSSEEDCILASLSLPTPVGVAYASDSKLDVLPNLEGSTHVSREMEALSDSRDYQQAESRARFHGNQNCKEERASTMVSDDGECTEGGVEEENENISAVVFTEPKDQRRCEGTVGDLCAAGAPDLAANSPMVTSSVAQKPSIFPPRLTLKSKGDHRVNSSMRPRKSPGGRMAESSVNSDTSLLESSQETTGAEESRPVSLDHDDTEEENNEPALGESSQLSSCAQPPLSDVSPSSETLSKAFAHKCSQCGRKLVLRSIVSVLDEPLPPSWRTQSQL